jgi:hypothetical protein
MPDPKGSFPDALILAALKRAELHSGRDQVGAHYSSIVAHLGLKMGSSTGHKLRPRIREMEAAGLIRGFKRRGAIVHTATPKGERVLTAAGEVVLPESPQHRHWREAREAATERIGGFRDDLQALMSEGAALLADEATDSEAWVGFGEKVGKACKRLGSATYCLREWVEPSDATADIEDSRHSGRRNPRNWD